MAAATLVSRRDVLVAIGAALAAPVLAGADPHMTPEERTKLLTYLRDSEQQFLALLAGVTDR